MKTIIHVNQHHIKHNTKHPDDRKPVLTVKTYRDTIYTNRVEIQGPSEVVYSPDKPLSCGARVWIETQSPVFIGTSNLFEALGYCKRKPVNQLEPDCVIGE